MTDEKKLKKAQSTYKSLCEMLVENDLHFERHDEDLVVTFGMSGDDIPMEFVLNVDADRELIRLISPLPLAFGENKRVEGAIATCQTNFRLADGSFDYDFEKGRILFRMTSSYKDSLISTELFKYMIACASYTVDEYNDKFFMLAKGAMSLEEFLGEK